MACFITKHLSLHIVKGNTYGDRNTWRERREVCKRQKCRIREETNKSNVERERERVAEGMLRKISGDEDDRVERDTEKEEAGFFFF